MILKDNNLDRIADALERKFGVVTYVDVSGVQAPNLTRIANALETGYGYDVQTLSCGTELDDLVRIAKAIEYEYNVVPAINIGNVIKDPVERIAYALEQGYGVERNSNDKLCRIAHALEVRYGHDPIIDGFGVMHGAVKRIAEAMESESFIYDPPVELMVMFDNDYVSGDTINYEQYASASVLRSSGRVTPVSIGDVTFAPETDRVLKEGRQYITATYVEEEN